MPITKNIDCQGRVTDTGQVQILDKGFCYSDTVVNPHLNDSLVWSVPGPLTPPNNTFQGIITGLTQATKYYINAYTVNTLGTAYSPNTQLVKTTGILNYPTVTIGVKNYDTLLPQSIFEMGKYNVLIVSGEVTQNDETLFTNGYIQQNGSTILSWNGFKQTYSNNDPPNTGYSPNTPLTVSFVADANNSSSWIVTHDVFYNCGSPQYQITSSAVSEAVFPIGWVVKNNYQLNATYFNPINLQSPYFYSDISVYPASNNDKLLEKAGNKTLLVTLSSFLNTLIIGAPVEYGNIYYSLDNSTWGMAPNQGNSTVSTGNILSPQPSWSHTYKTAQIKFTDSRLYGIPINIYIKFV